MNHKELVTALERAGYHYSTADKKFYAKDGSEYTVLEARAMIARLKTC